MGDVTQLAPRMRWWCEEANLGYDQGQRWNIYPGGECDCSSLVIAVLRECGFDTGNATYTGNMRAELTARGWAVVSRYPASSAGLREGDILLNDTNHVAMVTGPNTISQASIDERGEISGGQTGDQIDYETNTRSFYVYGHGGWPVVLRYVGGSTSAETPAVQFEDPYNPNGYSEVYVLGVQIALEALGYDIGPDGADGVLGKNTFEAVKAFQRDKGLVVDGIPGPQTKAALSGGSTTIVAASRSARRYTDITGIQAAVHTAVDNVAGPDTRSRVAAVAAASQWGGVTFPYGVALAQSAVGTVVDNIWGPDSQDKHDATVAAIQRAVGVKVDCIWGPVTNAAVNRALDGAEQP